MVLCLYHDTWRAREAMSAFWWLQRQSLSYINSSSQPSFQFAGKEGQPPHPLCLYSPPHFSTLRDTEAERCLFTECSGRSALALAIKANLLTSKRNIPFPSEPSIISSGKTFWNTHVSSWIRFGFSLWTFLHFQQMELIFFPANKPMNEEMNFSPTRGHLYTHSAISKISFLLQTNTWKGKFKIYYSN